jgi:GNAT superfamily N-acetyltransferase
LIEAPDAHGRLRPTLRPATEADLPFLLRLYASTREEELAGVDWPAAQRDAFLRQQFAAQHAWYHEQYPDASFDVVEVDGAPAGRLYVARWQREVRIVDVSLLPEHRGRGLGSLLLAGLFAEADTAGTPVSIHVERFNPALRLYARLGFALREDKGVYLLLERPVGAPRAPGGAGALET